MRELIKYDFISFTDKKWTDGQVDSYNAIQKQINKYIEDSVRVPETLLNGSHNLFSAYSMQLKRSEK